MKVIILGNGFDLASGLPTDYHDYFKYSSRVNMAFFSDVSLYLSLEKSSKISLFDENQYLNDIDFKKRYSLINDELNYYYDQLVEKMGKYKKTDISIWDIYFWYQSKKDLLNQTDWSDVELTIRKVIKFEKKDDALNLVNNKQEMLSESEWRSYFLGLNPNSVNSHDPSNTKIYSENIFNKLEEKNRIKIILAIFIKNKYNDTSKTYHNILLDELIKFENNFRDYIKLIADKIINTDQSNQKIYRDNLLELSDDFESSYYLINFNYTDFSGINPSSKVKMRRKNKDIEIVQQNVHGVYYKDVIFGVDQKALETDSNSYLFSKTYRKMDYYHKFTHTPLPNKDVIKEIVIYGHSLSKADYSYFQSIFDFYNIYGSTIIIKYYYSLYGNKNLHWQIKQRNLTALTNMMSEYGESMTNKDHGRNIVHKLLLENRLKFQVIKLKELNKELFVKALL